MAVRHISADEAFAVLSEESQNHHLGQLALSSPALVVMLLSFQDKQSGGPAISSTWASPPGERLVHPDKVRNERRSGGYGSS